MFPRFAVTLLAGGLLVLGLAITPPTGLRSSGPSDMASSTRTASTTGGPSGKQEPFRTASTTSLTLTVDAGGEMTVAGDDQSFRSPQALRDFLATETKRARTKPLILRVHK